MDDQDRRDIINALNRENRSTRQRILATLRSFKNWLYLVSYVLYSKILFKLESLWNWLRAVFA
jgi:hypothetical protein